jgi:hypothetical protein
MSSKVADVDAPIQTAAWDLLHLIGGKPMTMTLYDDPK